MEERWPTNDVEGIVPAIKVEPKQLGVSNSFDHTCHVGQEERKKQSDTADDVVVKGVPKKTASMWRLKEEFLVGDINEDGFRDSVHTGRMHSNFSAGSRSFGQQRTVNESWGELSAKEDEICAVHQETSSKRHMEQADILRVHRLGIWANLFNIFGTVMLLGYSILNLQAGRAREHLALADVTYISCFSGFFIFGLAELSIDASFQRTFRHRWYSLNHLWNVIISCLLIIGTTLDLAAFVMWREQKADTEKVLLYAVSHVLLLMGVIVLVISPPLRSKILSERLDDAGNVSIAVGSLCDCIAQYLDTAVGGHSAALMELVAAALWMLGALTYVISDGVCLHTWKKDLLVLGTVCSS